MYMLVFSRATCVLSNIKKSIASDHERRQTTLIKAIAKPKLNYILTGRPLHNKRQRLGARCSGRACALSCTYDLDDNLQQLVCVALMAAAYLNNAPYAPEASEPRGAFPHSRNLSTVSSATLHTSTTLHSPPTEPLLSPSAPGAEGYYEVLSKQSRGANRSSAHLRWDQSTAVDGAPLKREKKGLWDRVMQVKLSRWKWLKAGLEAVIGESSILRQSARAIGIIGISGIMRY
jgi:hypothetical protein